MSSNLSASLLSFSIFQRDSLRSCISAVAVEYPWIIGIKVSQDGEVFIRAQLVEKGFASTTVSERAIRIIGQPIIASLSWGIFWS